MSTGGVLGARVARSLGLSALAGSASVLAHLVVAQHLPPLSVVLVVAAVLLLADVTAGTVLRGRVGTGVRVLGLQVGAHVLLVTGTVAAGSGLAVTGGHHGSGSVDAGAVDSAAGLLPTWPMLLAHLVVALAVAALVSGAERAGRGALGLPALVRAAVRAVVALLPALPVPAAPVARPRRPLTRGAGSMPPQGVWSVAAPVRRGPPSPAAA